MNTLLSKKSTFNKKRNYCNQSAFTPKETKYLKYYMYTIVGGGILGSFIGAYSEAKMQKKNKYKDFTEIIFASGFGFCCGLVGGAISPIMIPLYIPAIACKVLVDNE